MRGRNIGLREREWSPNREERGLIKKSERINK